MFLKSTYTLLLCFHSLSFSFSFFTVSVFDFVFTLNLFNEFSPSFFYFPPFFTYLQVLSFSGQRMSGKCFASPSPSPPLFFLALLSSELPSLLSSIYFNTPSAFVLTVLPLYLLSLQYMSWKPSWPVLMTLTTGNNSDSEWMWHFFSLIA